MPLDDLEDAVHSKETFLTFLAGLRADYEASRTEERVRPSSPYGPAARGWENVTIDRFLGAMHAWMTDMGQRLPEAPSWNTFAAALMAGKLYE